MPTCAECGSTNVVEDDLYSERTLVCEDCGSVVTSEHLTTTRSEEEQGTSVPYYASTEVTKKPCRNLIKGIKRVHALCRIFRFPGDMEARTVELFEQAYAHPTFLQVQMDKKELLAGACIVAVARMSNMPVAMGTIGSLLEADASLLGAVYQDLTKSLNLQVVGASVTDLVESFCHGLNLTAEAVGADFAETTQRLTERATALVELAGDTWLVTGRHPVRIALATAYLAWQSLRPAARMKVSLADFCRSVKVAKADGKVPGNPVVLMRLRELKDVLCKLGAQLPWLRGAPVEPRKVVVLVEDIVKHRRLLLSMAMKSHEEAHKATANANITAESKNTSTPVEKVPVTAENVPEVGNIAGPIDNTPTHHTMSILPENTQATGDMAVTEETNITPGSRPELSCSTYSVSQVDAPGSGKAVSGVHLPEASAECLKPAGVKRRAEKMTFISVVGEPEEVDIFDGKKVVEERSPPAGQDPQCNGELPDDHWGKRQLFVPPCILLAKRPRMERGPDVTGDEEISDTEIESYIRTPVEVQDFMETQKWLTQEELMESQNRKSN